MRLQLEISKGADRATAIAGLLGGVVAASAVGR
jgi:hypothetical protein